MSDEQQALNAPETAPEPVVKESLTTEPAEQGNDAPKGRWVSTEEAAQLLGITARTVNRRAIAGQLQSRDKPGSHGREIWVDAALEQEAAERQTDDEDLAEQGSGASAAGSTALAPLNAELLYPFADVIAEQSRTIERLSAEVGKWKERAQNLEAQMQALPAGDVATKPRPWWKRFLGIE